MGRETKTGIGLAIVSLLGLLAYSELNPRAGILVLAIGLLTLVLVLFGTADSSISRFGRKGNDTILEAVANTTVDRPRRAPGLQTWTPPEGLQPWTPPTDLVQPGRAPAEEGPSPRPPAPEMPQRAPEPTGSAREAPPYDPSHHEPPHETDEGREEAPRAPVRSDHPWNDDGRWEARNLDRNPLDDLDRLDDVDVVAEVERIEARATATGTAPAGTSPAAGASDGNSLFSVPTPVNEDVNTDDDIIAASQATELTVTRTGNAELAKLLAKVQERLAAYE